MDIKVLYEDNSMVVINKPPGIVVNRAQSVKEETVQDWVEKRLSVVGSQLSVNGQRTTDNQQPITDNRQPTTDNNGVYNIVDEFVSRSGIVHRIDRETSGILLIAKTPQAFGGLKDQFLKRTIKKTYTALVHGQMQSKEGNINAPIGRLPWNREHFGVLPEGREAVTEYKVLDEYKKGKELYTLVEAYPKTGRTHQIRVHLKYVNHPIVADFLYAGRKTSRDDRKWAPRVMLHASQMELIHPTSQEPMTIKAPLPEDFQTVLLLLKK